MSDDDNGGKVEGMDDDDRNHYEAKVNEGPLTFTPPCNVTITSIRPVGGKVIVNGVEQQGFPVECGKGDSVIVTNSVVANGVIVGPIEIQWCEYPTDDEASDE